MAVDKPEVSLGDMKTEVSSVKDGGFSFAVGDMIGHYEVLGQLGRGGMGEVYHVRHTTLEIEYALKLLPADFFKQTGALARFKAEAKVMAKLNHPNVVKVDDFGDAENRYWLRMELMKGLSNGSTSMADLASAKGGKLDQLLLARIIKQALSGLQCAHDNKVIHRDLKPANILLSGSEDDFTVKIADFGLVKLVGEDLIRSMVEVSMSMAPSIGDMNTEALSMQGTSTNALLGTYAYMSPEQKQGKDLDVRSDLYSMGLIIFRLLTGQIDFSFDLPSQIDPEIITEWDKLVRNSLNIDPERRIESATKMMELISKIIEKIKKIEKKHQEAEDARIAKEKQDHLEREERLEAERQAVLEQKRLAEEQAKRTEDWLAEKKRLEEQKSLEEEKKRLQAQAKQLAELEQKRKEEAVKCYRKTAELGDAGAQFNLGVCYANGDGVDEDKEEAVKWYRKAAKRGNLSAQFNLGECYKDGTGVAKSDKKAVKWYRKAAVQGNVKAQNSLGFCYYDGIGVSIDYKKAVKWHRKTAEQGDAWAQNSLGFYYYNGLGVDEDKEEAVKWYRKAAEQGDADAQFNLGKCYQYITGVTKDDKEAVKWYSKAAEQGNIKAQNNLGFCYYNGLGVTDDKAEAVKWYLKAAEQGNAWAQNNLGFCYYNGIGVHRDYKEVVKWYRKAAEQGNENAQNGLAWYYAENNIKLSEAEKLSKQSLKNNPDPSCMDTLGWIYYNQGKYQEAEKELKKALSLCDKKKQLESIIEFKEHLSEVYIKQGEKEKSRKELEFILKNSKEEKQLTKIKKILKDIK